MQSKRDTFFTGSNRYAWTLWLVPVFLCIFSLTLIAFFYSTINEQI